MPPLPHEQRDVPDDFPLAGLQGWLQQSLTHPPESSRFSLDDVLTASQRLSAGQRWAVYQHAYFARLIDCLRAEFPAVCMAAGEQAFMGLCRGYLHAHPSQSHTLHALGQHFPAYLQATRPAPVSPEQPPDYADLLIDLARLERCYSEVFETDGPEHQPALRPGTLRELSAGDVGNVRLTCFECVRFMSLRFPCHEYASDVRQQREPRVPAPEPTHLVIFRRDYIVRRLPLEPWELHVLTALQSGQTLAEAWHIAAGQLDEQQLDGEEIRVRFARWTAAPLFRDVS